MITAIVTLTCETDTLGGLRTMLAEATELGIPDDTELLDGGHAHLDGADPITESGGTVADLRAWLELHTDVPGDTAIIDAHAIAVDAPVIKAERITCGEHIGNLPANVLVTVNPVCSDC